MPMVEKRGKITLRKVNMKDFPAEIQCAREVSNEFEKVNAIFPPRLAALPRAAAVLLWGAAYEAGLGPFAWLAVFTVYLLAALVVVGLLNRG